jgi:hypothetical protein
MRKWVHVLLLGAVLAVGAWHSLSDRIFISPDTGLRYLQVRTFEEYGWRQGIVPYPGLQFDPGMRFVPYYFAYSRYGDGLLLMISLFFALTVAAMRTLFGPAGIVIVPVIGTLVAAASVAGLWQLAGFRHARWLFWGTALATPLLFYSLTLWDHSIGVGLSTLGVYLAARALEDRRWIWPAGAGFAIALAVLQRPDVGPMAIALGGALLATTWRRWRLPVYYGIGGLFGLLVMAPLNVMWAGHPLGVVIARPYLGYLSNTYNPFASYWENVELTRAAVATRQLLAVEAGQPLTLVAALLLVAGSVFLAIVLRMPPLHRRSLLYGSFAMIVAGTILGLLPARYGQVNGIFTTLPLFGLALAYVEHPEQGVRVYRLVFLAAWLYVILTLLVVRAPGGIQWGGRYLLPAVPLLFFLALYAVVAFSRQMQPAEARALNRVAAVLVILSLLVQVAGVRAMFRAKADLKQWQTGIGSLEAEVILTNSSIFASYMTGLDEKIFFYVDNEAEVALLAERLAAQGEDRFAFVPFPLPPGAPPVTIPEQAGSVQIEADGPLEYRLAPAGQP